MPIVKHKVLDDAKIYTDSSVHAIISDITPATRAGYACEAASAE